MAFVAPFGLAFILNATLGSAAESTVFEFGIVNADAGDVGRGLEGLLGELATDEVVKVTTVQDRATLDRLVGDGELNAGFVLEPDFSARIETGGQAGITVVGNRNAPISVSVAEAIAQGFASEVDYVSDSVATVAAAGGIQDPGEVAQIAAMAAGVAPPVSIGTVAEEGRGFDPTSYYAVSLSVFFVFFTVQFGVLSLIEEKEIGTLGRLIASPTPAAAMIVGKFVSSFVLGVVSMSAMVFATTVVMGAEWGSLPLVALIIVLGVGSAMALALVVSAFAKTAEQATAGASMLAVVLGLFGGAFFPVGMGPAVLNTISYLTPHRWLLESMREVSFGGGIADIVPAIVVLLVFIVVVGGAGLWGSSRRILPT
jgi:ABC-2 type transport system permease protein